jgi:uncharacterized damage-inducible protein DinB
MISPAYVVMMAEYNSEMNRRLYTAASRLGEAERRADRGAFWRSIHGTLSHLVWGDKMWMSRFAGWPKPSVVQADSATMIESWEELVATRERADADIEVWAARLDAAWLADDLTWFSGGAGREVRRPRWLLVTHFFNHQTHHRGQVHAMLTAADERTGDTDLPVIVSGV